MGCLWESTYFDMYGDCVWSCLDPERAGSACFCGGPDETASCYKDADEHVLLPIAKSALVTYRQGERA